MPVLPVTLEEIYQLIDQLEEEKKLKIFERLKAQLLLCKWDELFRRVDQQIAANPITEEEISDEVARGREAFAAGRS